MWRKVINGVTILALTASVMMAAPVMAQNSVPSSSNPAQASPAGRPGAAPNGQGQQNSGGSDDLVSFLNDAGTVAGALSVCAPEAYTAVRLCSILIVSHWQGLGNTMPRDQNRLTERLEQTWRNAAGRARNLQAGANAPTDCETLQRAARALPFWQTCDSARRLQAAVEERNRGQAGTRPQPGTGQVNRPPVQQPQTQGGGTGTRPPPRNETIQLQ